MPLKSLLWWWVPLLVVMSACFRLSKPSIQTSLGSNRIEEQDGDKPRRFLLSGDSANENKRDKVTKYECTQISLVANKQTDHARRSALSFTDGAAMSATLLLDEGVRKTPSLREEQQWNCESIPLVYTNNNYYYYYY